VFVLTLGATISSSQWTSHDSTVQRSPAGVSEDSAYRFSSCLTLEATSAFVLAVT
jgi:hypothetical protein